METNCLDWKRIESAIRQEARRVGKQKKVAWVIDAIRELMKTCGPASSSRAMCVRIGTIILKETQTIIVPSCPMEYEYKDGRFSFGGVRSGISFLTERHILFVKKIKEILPDASPLFLVPDQEAMDPELSKAMKVAEEELAELMRKSTAATKQTMEHLGWKAEAMTSAIPGIVLKEKEAADWIAETKTLADRVRNDTIVRQDMYRALAQAAGNTRRMTEEEMIARTIRTASQYVALGRYAAEHGLLIVNHTTTNLKWYADAQAAVLHNPVSIY